MRAGISLIVIALTMMAGFFTMPAIKAYQQSKLSISPPTCFATTSPCSIDDTTVTLSVDSVTPLTPATLTVNWPTQAETLSVRLQGHEMEMGEIRLVLQSRGDNTFTGEVILPVCTLEKMTWYGEVSDGSHRVYAGIRMQR
ncbi:hypothetical protein [Vibrio astriarenae]|uniref:hypothetical protein n=1 Tax=Vibrio astriarenae TaxID=1481923 RepID=UPI003736163F